MPNSNLLRRSRPPGKILHLISSYNLPPHIIPNNNNPSNTMIPLVILSLFRVILSHTHVMIKKIAAKLTSMITMKPSNSENPIIVEAPN